MKKVVAILLVLVMVFSAVACSDQKAAETKPAENKIEENKEKETKKEEAKGSDVVSDTPASPNVPDMSKTLTITAQGENNCKAIEYAAQRFQQLYPEFTFEISQTDNIKTLLTAIGQSEEYQNLTDIFLLNDTVAQNYINAYGDKMFKALADDAVDFADYSPAKVGFTSMNGIHYGVPYDASTAVFIYRLDTLEAAGYTLADMTDITWDRFIEIGKDVYAKTGMPLMSAQSGAANWLALALNSAGSALFDADGKCIIAGNEAIKEIFRVYKELRDNNILLELASWNEYCGSFAAGLSAGTAEGCFIIRTIVNTDPPGTWGITNLPSFNLKGATHYGNSGGSSFYVSGVSENYDLAVMFLKFMTTDEDSVNYGMNDWARIPSYIPAQNYAAFGKPAKGFGDQLIWRDVISFASNSPVVEYGIYYDTAKSAYTNAIYNAYNGGDLATELQTAQDTVDFAMSE